MFRKWLYDWFGIHHWRYFISNDNPFGVELEMRECKISGRIQLRLWMGGICSEPMWDDIEYYE